MWVFLVKFSLSIITFGEPFPGGIFLPSMIWGALYGRIMGELVHLFQQIGSSLFLFNSCPINAPCIIPGVYSILGAIGAFGGITKLNLSLTVLMFELTGTPDYVIPCMITLVAAKTTSDYFQSLGIVSVMIKRKGYPYLDPRREILSNKLIEDIMTVFDKLVCFRDGMKVFEIQKILSQTEFSGYPVINSQNNICVGYITRQETNEALEMIPIDQANQKVSFKAESNHPINISSYVNHSTQGVECNTTLEFILELFKKFGTRFVLVEEMGELKGLLTKKDLLAVLDGEFSDSLSLLNQEIIP
jgi:chloride channel 3/4/5